MRDLGLARNRLVLVTRASHAPAILLPSPKGSSRVGGEPVLHAHALSESWWLAGGWALVAALVATAPIQPTSRSGWRRLVTVQGLLLLAPWLVAAAWELCDPGGSGRSVVVSMDGDTRPSGVPLHFDIPGAFTMSVLPFVATSLLRALACPRLARLALWSWAWLAPVMAIGAVALTARRGDGAAHLAVLALIVAGLGGCFAMLATSLLAVLAVLAWLVTALRDGRPAEVLAVLPFIAMGIAFASVSARYGAPIGVHGALDEPSPFYLVTAPACAAVLVAAHRHVHS